jgi:membrane protease YdiL (CAAX protease family)
MVGQPRYLTDHEAWGIWALVLVEGLFSTVIGEELLFRGLLLPRMSGVLGRWDWAMNGLLFGLYHLHQPRGLLGAAVEEMLLFSSPSRYFRSSWFGIIAHSGQSVLFAILILGLVLGLALREVQSTRHIGESCRLVSAPCRANRLSSRSAAASSGSRQS